MASPRIAPVVLTRRGNLSAPEDDDHITDDGPFADAARRDSPSVPLSLAYYKACNKDGALVTTDSKDRPTTSKSGMPSWLKRVIMFAILGAVLVIVYFILAAFLPRWWAERIGELSDRGFARGITWGLLFGGLCTLVPLLQVLLAVLFRHKRGGRVIAGIATLLALLFALPNLMTLSVVLGGNSAAHAGQRIMDVEAPGFRGASLVGAIIAALVFVGVVVLTIQYRRRGRQLAKARAQ